MAASSAGRAAPRRFLAGRGGRRSLWRVAFLLLLCVVIHASLPAAANPPPCPVPALVSAVADGETLVLAAPLQGASTVHLAGIAIPGEASPHDPFAEGADHARADTGARSVDAAGGLATTARRLVAELTAGRAVCIELGGSQGGLDRYGRLPAQVHAQDGTWVQGRLLALGLARVRPMAPARGRLAEMLAIEHDARTAQQGLWRLRAFQVRRSGDAERAPPGLQIVEGRVLEAQRRGDWWYLNFGEDWRRDFTVMIGKNALPAFAAAGLQPFALKGQNIRVRGVLQRWNGPMIEVSLPEQIELVDTVRG